MNRKRLLSQNKSAFVISPIGKPNSSTRKRSDARFKHILEPECKNLRYSITRSDKLRTAGIITLDIIKHISGDDLIIADLTDQNPNVFYELAICHSLNKPVLMLVSKGQKIPFDISSMRVVAIDDKNLRKSKTDIRLMLKSFLEDPESFKGESPISMFKRISEIKTKGKKDATKRQIVKVVQEYSDKAKIRSEHYKRITDEATEAWSKAVPKQYNILYLEFVDGKVAVRASPFIETPNIIYFESHLETGYSTLWKKIENWKESYSKLVERTEKLIEKTSSHVKELNILPEYDRSQAMEEHINYALFPYGYFYQVWKEIEFKEPFKDQLSTYMSGNEKWYTISAADQAFAQSLNEEKILYLRGEIEKFHNNQIVFKEFKDVFDESQKMNAQLPSIVIEVENVRAKVNNDVPLKGWCDTGLEGKYEVKK